MNPNHPTQCEVTGCHSMYLGTNASGVPIRKRGKADVFVTVDDQLRGVCCACYARTISASGHARLAGLVDDDGRVDAVKLQSHWESIAQTEIEEIAKRQRYGREAA